MKKITYAIITSMFHGFIMLILFFFLSLFVGINWLFSAMAALFTVQMFSTMALALIIIYGKRWCKV